MAVNGEKVLLLLLLMMISSLAYATAQRMPPKNSSDVKSSTPYRVELIDTGGPKSGNSSDYFFLKLSSLEPGSGNFELRLYRDPTLNSQLTKNTNYNVFVIDENGDDQRVDGLDLYNDHRQEADSKVAFFRGHLVGRLLFSDGQDDVLIEDSLVIAMGYLDGRNGFISLQAFLRKEDGTLLYLHPSTEKEAVSSTATASNLHFLSQEDDQLGGSFFEHFKRQFEMQQQQQQQQQSLRRKREAVDGVEKRCPMMILADYSLYQLMNESRAKTVLFVHFVFTLANDILESTTFTRSGLPPGSSLENAEEEEVGEETVYSGYGHALCRIVIEEHLAERESDQLFNGGRKYWPQAELEQKLRKFKDRNKYCIAFLFTSLPIRASPDSQFADPNGFAQQGGIFSSIDALSNVGVVSFANCNDPWNLRCALTFPHELGHLWGAPHDIDTEECMPPLNGSYLVSFPFLDQLGPNNFKFSPCSIRWIFDKIERLSADGRDFTSYCTKCGNGQIEENEECDEFSFVEGSDVHSLDQSDDEAVNGRRLGGCCTRSCKLKKGARCSPSNHQCCDDRCEIVPANRSQQCLSADLQYCFAASFCDGTLDGCPGGRKLVEEARPVLPDGTACLNGGTCLAGVCNSSCPAGSVGCDCPAWAVHGCKICCQAVLKNGSLVTRDECRPVETLYRQEGTGCFFNETEKGFCTADGWCRLPRREQDGGGGGLNAGTLIPVTVPSVADEGAGDDGEFDFWAFMQVFAVILVAVALFATVLLVRAVYRWKSTGTFELYDDKELTNSNQQLLNHESRQQQQQQQPEPEVQESCFSTSCLPGRSAKLLVAATPPSSHKQQQPRSNGFSGNGTSNV